MVAVFVKHVNLDMKAGVQIIFPRHMRQWNRIEHTDIDMRIYLKDVYFNCDKVHKAYNLFEIVKFHCI